MNKLPPSIERLARMDIKCVGCGKTESKFVEELRGLEEPPQCSDCFMPMLPTKITK